jgi:hypothetical protein
LTVGECAPVPRPRLIHSTRSIHACIYMGRTTTSHNLGILGSWKHRIHFALTSHRSDPASRIPHPGSLQRAACPCILVNSHLSTSPRG